MGAPTDRLTDAIEQPSDHPLRLLTLRQFIIIQARAYGHRMAATARQLSISRETLYQDLRAAVGTLKVHGRTPMTPPACIACAKEPRLPGRRIGRRCRNASLRAWDTAYRKERRTAMTPSSPPTVRPDTRRSDGYACPDHELCPAECRHLRGWLASFNAAHPPPAR